VLAALLQAGCMCCSADPSYEVVQRGEIVEIVDFTPPTCYSCTIKIDVINSHRTVVRVLYEGDPEDFVQPITWDTGAAPEDTYIIRAWQDNERIDSWVVLVHN
jgi:hypothetical protein